MLNLRISCLPLKKSMDFGMWLQPHSEAVAIMKNYKYIKDKVLGSSDTIYYS